VSRKFSWGICDIEDNNHSDFALLHKLVLFFFSKSAMELTECFNEDFMHNNIRNNELRFGFFSGFLVGCTAFGVLGLLGKSRLGN